MRLKLIILLVGISLSTVVRGQTFAPPRSNSSVTVQDSRWRALLNMYAPHIRGFNQGNGFGLNQGLDTLGGLVYDDSSRHVWYRDTVLSGGHAWRMVLSSADSALYATKYSVDTMRIDIYGQLATKVGLSAISGTPPIQFNQSTGIISCPTCSVSGSGGFNSNVGSGYRFAVANTNNIKTIFGNSTAGISLDSSSNTNAITINQQVASASQNGYLSSSDWTTFNSKGSPITSSNQQIIFNNAGTLGGATQFLYNTASNILSVGSSTGTSNGTIFVGGTSTGTGTVSSGGGQLTVAGSPLILSSIGGSLIFQTNSSNRAIIDNSGNFSVNSLTGTGTRLVTSNFSGLLGNFSNSANTIVGYDNGGNLVNMVAGPGISIAGGIISNTGGGGGGGNTNSNVGSGYRWAIPNTNNIKTFFVSGGTLDSTTNTNGLTLIIPTYQSNLSNTGSGYRWFVTGSSIRSFVCSGCTLDSTTNSGSLTLTVSGSTFTGLVNKGSGYRLAIGGADTVKTLYAGTNINIDSTTNPGGITITASGGGGTPANPTATIGLTTVNGTATTYMRSDAAPPLSQAIVPTWTGTHTFNGGVVLGSSVTFDVDNSRSIGTSSIAANGIYTRFLSSSGSLTLISTGATSIAFSPNGVNKMALASSGQLQLAGYNTSTSFTGTGLAFLQTDASGNIIQVPVGSVGGAQTWQQTLTTGSTLNAANNIVNTGQTFTWTNGGTGLFKLSGFSHDTTSTLGPLMMANDSSVRGSTWTAFATKLSGYLPTFNIYGANGLTSAGGDSIYLGGALNQNTTLATAGFNLNITGLPNKSSLLGTDSALINDVSGKTWKVPTSVFGGGSSLPTGVSPLYLQATGPSTYQFADPRQLDTFYVVDDGQSNDFGNADTTNLGVGDTTSDNRLLVQDTVTGGWKVARCHQYPFNLIIPGTSYSLSHSFYFARKIVRQTGAYVKLIHNGHNGATISQWYTSGASQPFLDSLVNRIIRFQIPRIDFFIWDQGESDASTVPSVYSAAWDSVKFQLRRRTVMSNATPVFVVGMPQIALGAPSGYQGIDPTLQTFDYNWDLADLYITSDSGYVNSSAANPVHFNHNGLKYIGEINMWEAAQSKLYYTRNNPGTLPGAPINPGRITVRYSESPGAGAYYDGVNIMNRVANGRTGVHLLSSDSTSTVGVFSLAGPSSSYLEPNSVALATESNSNLELVRNFVAHINLTASADSFYQQIIYSPSSSQPFKLTGSNSSGGESFQFFGPGGADFTNMGMNNSGSASMAGFYLYYDNGYRLLATPNGTIYGNGNAATYPTGGARAGVDINTTTAMRVDSFAATFTILASTTRNAWIKTGSTNDTAYLPSTPGLNQEFWVMKTDAGSGTVSIYDGGSNHYVNGVLNGKIVLTNQWDAAYIQYAGNLQWYVKYIPSSVGSSYTFANGLTNSSGTVTLGGTLTGATTLIGTGQTFTYTAGGTGLWKWSGLSHDTTSTFGAYVGANDSSMRLVPWSILATKLGITSYTFTNGLTNTSGTVKLGGSLTGNSTVAQGGNLMQFTSGQFQIGNPAGQTVTWSPPSTSNSYFTVLPGTLNDAGTGSGGTQTSVSVSAMQGGTLTATNTSVTYTSAYGLTITPPTAGTNITITNNYALGVFGNSQFTNGTISTPSIAINNWQTVTSGTTSTISNGQTNWLLNPTSLITTFTVTLPSAPTDGQLEKLHFGGTLTSGNPVVTTLTVSPNSGQTLEQTTAPTAATGGTCIIYQYNAALSVWFREQ